MNDTRAGGIPNPRRKDENLVGIVHSHQAKERLECLLALFTSSGGCLVTRLASVSRPSQERWEAVPQSPGSPDEEYLQTGFGSGDPTGPL